MKKQYIKPMMESEAFVANEYVAACWTVTCENATCGAVEYGYDALKSEVTTETYFGNEMSVHTGTFGEEGYEKGPCMTYTEETRPSWCDKWWEIRLWDNWLKYWFSSQQITKYHPVVVTSGHPNHPNASA